MIINMNGAKAPETPSSVLQEKTVTPETLPTVIGPDEGYDGLSQVTVNPDSQLIPTNIRSGKTVFGVTGTFEGETVGGVDYTKIGVGDSNTMEYALGVGYSSLIEESPSNLTELNLTNQYLYDTSSTDSVHIQYGNGCLVSGKRTNGFRIMESSYVPSISSYKWYYKSGTIPSGKMKFYCAFIFKDAVKNATNIKGDAYLLPVLQLPYGSEYPLSYSMTTKLITSQQSELPEPIKITVDAPLVDSDITGYLYSKMFTLDVPELTFGSYSYISNSYTASKACLSYVLLPDKIVIS